MASSNNIKRIIDAHLGRFVEDQGNVLPAEIELEMADPIQDKNEEWRVWFPVDSKVTDNEIKELEKQLGCEYPEDYKIFLKHKHFYELHISEASFFEHSINNWKISLTEIIFHENMKDDVIEKGLIPFAIWEDWGYLCFDTNRNREDCNYPIVLWNNEWPDKVEDKYGNFYDFIMKNDID
ncbi:SMI1/KNR4 family protein [Flavobacterium collinsii]|uniref:Knr4/Smi1-like domain-containing protein n=1 Tax=Flavobacterium collinsii TaxID=1114861 RepID=A0ABM8KL16_9FLAO|nr:SMI1/KNR4 family protein [Flavobacterium collinsii]CAA9200221.1 hypothetical protein FLACOL7796_03122 [Flavobacterium collinsii]